jgi:hypothetical protein
MRARRPRRPSHPPPDVERGLPLDPEVVQGLVAHLILLRRCGYSSADIESAIRLTADWLARSPPGSGTAARSDIDDPAHVISVWRSNGAYLRKGKPRPLPLRGPPPSLQSLVREVNPYLDFDAVVKYFEESDSLVKVKGGYIPRGPSISTRGSARHAAHQLRTLDGQLINTDHNSMPRSAWPSWYDFTAETAQFPVSKLKALQLFGWKQANLFVTTMDEYLTHQERARDPNEPTIRVAWTVNEFRAPSEEQSPALRHLVSRIMRHLASRSAPNLRPASVKAHIAPRRKPKRGIT